MVLAFAGDSTMTSVLVPAGAPTSSSSGMTGAAAPRRAFALVVAFVFSVFFADARAFVAPAARFPVEGRFFVAMLSVPSGCDRRRSARQSRPPPSGTEGRRVRFVRRSAKVHAL